MPRVIPEYKERAKRRIVDEAIKAFSEKGYHQTRMTDIAENLGVSKGAIYQYFDSKEELFMGVLESIIETWQEGIFSFLEAGDVTVISSNEYFDRAFGLLPEFQDLSFELINEAAHNESFREKMIGYSTERFALARRRIAEIIDEQKRKGIVRSDVDSASLLVGFMALRQGLNDLLLLGLDVSEARKVWLETTRMILNDMLVSP